MINEEGARIAEAGRLSVVMDRCIKVEHARYVGRMHWLGFNTQRITSVRGGIAVTHREFESFGHLVIWPGWAVAPQLTTSRTAPMTPRLNDQFTISQ